MLEEVYKAILDKVDVTAMDKFQALLRRSITVAFLPEHDPNQALRPSLLSLGHSLRGWRIFIVI